MPRSRTPSSTDHPGNSGTTLGGRRPAMLRISSPRNQAVIMIELAEPGLPRRREAGTPLDAATPPRFPVGLADAGPGLGSTTRQVRTAQLAGPGPFPTAGGSTAPSRKAAAFEKGTTHVYRRRNDHRDRAHRGCHHVLPQALTRTFPHSRSPTYVKNLRSRTPGVRYVHRRNLYRGGRSGREVVRGRPCRLAASPGLLPFLLPAEGAQVQEVIRATGGLKATGVLGVRMEHPAVGLEETAPARHLQGLI
jgi:hypothetical protein